MNARRNVVIALMLYIGVVLLLVIPTWLALVGMLAWQYAILLYAIAVAMERAATWIGAWNNILGLVEKVSGNKVASSVESRSAASEASSQGRQSVHAGNIPPSPSMYTCFIANCEEDNDFAARLYSDLKSRGVKVWRFPEDAGWGKTVWGEIDNNIKANDKLIAVLSARALKSGPILREIERALSREDREAKEILFPVNIDEFLFSKDPQGNEVWRHPRKADIVSKVAGDFCGWNIDTTKYDTAFNRLLLALQP